MTTRTFVQQGQGYGATPVNITVKIDGNTIFSGPVPTVDAPPPTLPNLDLQITSNLYTWTNDVSYSGQQTFELTVNDGSLLLTKSFANYTPIYDEATGNITPGNESTYASFFYEMVDGVIINDPFTNEQIDGVPQIEHPDPASLSGQWWWQIPNGSTFTATLNTNAGSQ